MTDEQDEALERAQVGALRAIFDNKLRGRKLREKAGVSTLRDRRVKHCDNFAQNVLNLTGSSIGFPKELEGEIGKNTMKLMPDVTNLKIHLSTS